ncbi:hypothetical protein EYF80_042497 [Liparis tanakae]|uniref:Uncharacterized protein n=1 Tax=Liparis tanakae TaxID=230148 RepID=A0A4Z2G1E4_9TELE|nr:hypothetical protein EYF80_042497 [Liparis tanakae]
MARFHSITDDLRMRLQSTDNRGGAGVLGEGEADPVLSPVEDAVELCEEDVSQDPHGAFGGHDVRRLETTEAELLVAERLLGRSRFIRCMFKYMCHTKCSFI